MRLFLGVHFQIALVFATSVLLVSCDVDDIRQPSSREATAPFAERRSKSDHLNDGAVVGSVEARDQKEEFRSVWISDVRDDIALLHFGIENSGAIEMTWQCRVGSGRVFFSVPNYAAASIELRSGDAVGKWSGEIRNLLEDGEVVESSFNLIDDLAGDDQLITNFWSSGSLLLIDLGRNIDARSPHEVAEIDKFFSACISGGH